MSNMKVTKDMSDNIKAAAILANFYLNKRDRLLEAHPTDHDKVVFKGSNLIPLKIGDNWFFCDTDVNISTATDLDTGTVEAGKDYYVYACDNNGSLEFKISLNSTYPDGFNANNSRKIGGFHTLCADVGSITDHPLSGYVAADILPASVWDLKHRPRCSPEGMVYSEKAGIWVDIYLQSGTGSNTASVYGGTITDSRNWMDFVDDLAAVGKQLLSDAEFQIIAQGSNEETNISDSADPVTTGGHSDTAGRRMISNIGCEDCCGAMWQWLRDQSYRLDGQSHTHTQTITHKETATGSAIYKDQAESTPNAVLGSGADETITGNATDPTPSWSWYNLPGGKGSLYKQGSYGDVKLLAGGSWHHGTFCGSRSRNTGNYRWDTSSNIGCRGRSEPL